ncbi:hypothetical protein GOBAR_AA02582 [Gossypium barbadense]|uniref:Uncharacterized protein n=1 Tax=Gossypium barbadense TaxID=3634 RepID=A0A2P5YQX5_GOSBA|nr:hypothetical protein GOBAR_AA02582 [Gossypium barbadense]
MIRLEEDTPVVVEVGFHNHGVQRKGYRGGRAGHGSRGETVPVECQSSINVIKALKTLLLKSSKALRDVRHTQDALWGHLTNEGEGRCLRRRVEEAEISRQESHIKSDGYDSLLMSLRLMANSEGNEIGKTRVVGGRSRNEGPPAVGGRQVDVAMEGVKIIIVEDRAEFECELKVCRLDDLEKEAPWVSRQKGSDRVSQLDLFKCDLVNATARS